MLRSALLAMLILSAPPLARAQLVGEPPAAVDSGVDFVLRPADEPIADGSDDFWVQQLQPPQSAIDTNIGPPLAGPTGEEPVGPPLAGPFPEPPDVPLRVRPRGIEEEADAFAPVGVRLGSFIFRPSIDVGVEATDNIGGDAEDDEEGAVGALVAPELIVRSGDDRHELEAELRGEAIWYEEDQFDEREAEARVRARYDLTSRTSLNAEAGYSFYLDSFTDPDTPSGAAERPPVQNFDAALGVTHRFGPIALGLRGEVDREVHGDVALAGGGTASLEDLNNTEYGARLRASYDARKAFTPFIEVAAGRRDYDEETDNEGFERASLWGELRGGLIVDLLPKLDGEVSVGYRREDLDDERLEDINSPVLNVALMWSPRRLTEVRLDFSTETRSTSITGASGSVLYSSGLSISRSFTPRVVATIGGGFDHEDFIGVDQREDTYSAFADMSYAFNRFVAVVGRYAYEKIERTDGVDTDENSVSLRMRFQR